MATQRQAQRAAEQNADDLSNFPNVVGIGVQALDVIAGPPEERHHAVAVYVTRKLPSRELDLDDRLPEYVEIAGRRGPVRVPVKVVESGPFSLDVDADGTGDEALIDGALIDEARFGPE